MANRGHVSEEESAILSTMIPPMAPAFSNLRAYKYSRDEIRKFSQELRKDGPPSTKIWWIMDKCLKKIVMMCEIFEWYCENLNYFLNSKNILGEKWTNLRQVSEKYRKYEKFEGIKIILFFKIVRYMRRNAKKIWNKF